VNDSLEIEDNLGVLREKKERTIGGIPKQNTIKKTHLHIF